MRGARRSSPRGCPKYHEVILLLKERDSSDFELVLGMVGHCPGKSHINEMHVFMTEEDSIGHQTEFPILLLSGPYRAHK